MPLTQTINYDNALNFSFDTDAVEISGSSAVLKATGNPGANQLLKATVKVQVNAEYSSTSNVTATLGTNTTRALIGSNYYYDMTTNVTGQDSVAFDGANANFGAIGTIRWKFRPDYSGNPAGRQELMVTSAAVSNNNNLILFRHDTDGVFKILISGSSASIATTNIGAWSPTADTDYEIELNFDLTNGASRLFIDGEQLGSTITTIKTVGTRGQLKFGVDAAGSGLINGSVRDIEIFSTVQHTANFTEEIPRLVAIYDTDNPTIIVSSGFSATELASITETATKSGSDEVKYTFNYNSNDYYVSGGVLASSDGTYSQANTAAEIEAAMPLDISPNASGVKLRAHLHSDDGSTTPQLTTVAINYESYVALSEPTRCQCFGYLLDNDTVPTNKRVWVYSKEPFHVNDNSISINEVVCDKMGGFESDGYYLIDLPETTTANVKLFVEESWTDSRGVKQKRKYRIMVPASASSSFEDMVTT
jgi:hypothetical protein